MENVKSPMGRLAMAVAALSVVVGAALPSTAGAAQGGASISTSAVRAFPVGSSATGLAYDRSVSPASPAPMPSAGMDPVGDCQVVSGVNDRCPLWAQVFGRAPDGCVNQTCYAAPEDQGISGDTVFITGDMVAHEGGSGQDIATVAYSVADGSTRWVATYDSPGHGQDWGYGIAVSPKGKRVYVTGEADTAGGIDDFVTIAYDQVTGRQLWSAIYHGSDQGYDGAARVAVSSDGSRVYVTGLSLTEHADPVPPSLDFVTLSYVASTGRLDWATRYDDPRHGDDQPIAIAVTGRDIYVTGAVDEGLTQDLGTVAYRDLRKRHAARQLWAATYDSGAWDRPSGPNFTPSIHYFGLGAYGSMAATRSTVVIAGTSFMPRDDGCDSDPSDWSVVAYDRRTGAQRWVDVYSGANLGSNVPASLVAAPDGRTVYVTGYGSGPGPVCISQATTIAYDPDDGAHRWVAGYSLPTEEDAGLGVAVSRDSSSVYVSGTAELADVVGYKTDSLTLAYGADGSGPRWVGRYRDSEYAGMGYGYGMFESVSDDGGAVLTSGRFHPSLHNPNEYDLENYGTLAYAAS